MEELLLIWEVPDLQIHRISNLLSATYLPQLLPNPVPGKALKLQINWFCLRIGFFEHLNYWNETMTTSTIITAAKHTRSEDPFVNFLTCKSCRLSTTHIDFLSEDCGRKEPIIERSFKKIKHWSYYILTNLIIRVSWLHK